MELIKKENVTSLGKIINMLTKVEREEAIEPKVYLFFSVDFVNSTRYKTMNKEWSLVLRGFYDIIKSEIIKEINNIVVWKYAGDEVLFYLEIDSVNQLVTTPYDFYEGVMQAQHELTEEFGGLEGSIYLKSSIWIAEISEFGRDSEAPERCRNISLALDENMDLIDNKREEPVNIEFVGIDIDEGFRMITNLATQNKLTLDPKVALIIYKNQEILEYEISQGHLSKDVLDYIRIVGLEYLKGVWDGRAYPIIWMADSWDEDRTFLYDEHLTNKFIETFDPNHPKSKLSYISVIENDYRKLKIEVDNILMTIKKGKRRKKEQNQESRESS